MDIEENARAISLDRIALFKRLRDARYCLVTQHRRTFGKGTFDFENKRLIGENGFILQWKMRQKPYEPEHYRNQQTSTGIVILLER